MPGNGSVYVADTDNNAIRKITTEGVVSTLAGCPVFSGTEDGTGSRARFSLPWVLAADESGNVYVASGNRTIRKPYWMCSYEELREGLVGNCPF